MQDLIKISIIGIIGIIITIIGISCHKDDKKKNEVPFISKVITASGVLILIFNLLLNNFFWTYSKVNLTRIPNNTEYYICYPGEKKYIQYMDGNSLISEKVDNLEIVYDSKDGLYMEIEEGKNIINQTVKKNVTIHMTVEGNE